MRRSGQGIRYSQQGPVGVGGDLDVQAAAVSLAGEVVPVTSAVAGGDVGAVQEDEAAADRLAEVGDMQTECLADQR